MLGADEFWIPDEGAMRHVTTQPAGFLFAGTPSGSSLATLPWVSQARMLFDIETQRVAGQGQEEQAHLYAWRHALKPRVQQEALSAFARVSPERENLQLNMARDLRDDYMPLILGGAESRWSTVKVAEVFARAVSLKRVQASFVVALRGQPEAPVLLPNTNDQVSQAHKAMLDGMEKVTTVGSGGFVANEMRRLHLAASKRGLVLKVYAKTGTPRVEAVAEGARTTTLQSIADARLLTWSKRSEIDGLGWSLSYRGKPIDTKLILSLPDDKSGAFGGAAKQRELLRFLAVVNRQSGVNQSWYCKIRGASISCPDPHVLTKKDDDGRNLAMVLVVSKPDGAICRSIAVAYSLSVRGQGDQPYHSMVRETLSAQGPVAEALGLVNDVTCPS